MGLGEKLSQLRKEQNQTQAQIATQLHVTRQAVSNWEQNKSTPDIETLKRLAQIFKVDLNELLGDEGVVPEVQDGKKLLIWTLVFNLVIVISWTIVGNSDFHALLITFIYFLCSLTVYVTFELALRSNDFTMVAGYSHKTKYNQRIARKVVSLIQQQIVIISLLYTLLQLIVAEWLPSFNWGLLVLGYCVHFIVTIVYVKYQYRNQLFINEEERIQQQREGVPGLFFMVYILVIIVGVGICFITFNIQNNTTPAFKIVAIMLGWMIWDIILMFMSSKQVKKYPEAPFMKKYAYSIFGSSLTVLLLMVIFIIGYQLGN